ncbi:MAG: hypothetical protein AMXMBFR34_53620 [Myxococcaceae bacterium]
MDLHLSVVRDDALPKLGWYAEIDLSRGEVRAEVGPWVEVDAARDPRWLVAGVWDGDFPAGDFHRAEHLFGSGLRLEKDGLYVVPASTTDERVMCTRDSSRWYVSNSLVVLLGRLGARVDPTQDHRAWGDSVGLGIFHYQRQLPLVSALTPVAWQLVYETLRLTAEGPSFHYRSRPHAFRDFHDYTGQVMGALRATWSNATHPARRHPARAASTISRGYDSATATAFATELVPALEAWTASTSNTRVPGVVQRVLGAELTDDDGATIARTLGATPRHLDLDYKAIPLELEASLWASNQLSPELVFWSLFEDAERHPLPTVLFTGNYGDAIWDCRVRQQQVDGYVSRGAPSGPSLIEARLRSGVVELPVPYVFARSVKAVHAISMSQEMAPWRLGNDYDRPIPRRLLENRGVPRDAFGSSKRAVAQDYESPRGQALRRLFFDESAWTELEERLYRGINLGLYLARRGVDFIEAHGERGKMPWAHTEAKRTLARVADLQRATFTLCTGLLAAKYAREGVTVRA